MQKIEKKKNIGKYLGTSSTIYKSEELGISDLDKSIEICKKIELEENNFRKYQEEISNQIQDILEETKDNLTKADFDYFTNVDKVIACKNGLVKKYNSFEEILDTALKDLRNIMTDDAFLKYQSGINETKNNRKSNCNMVTNAIDQFVASLFKTDVENTLLQLNTFLKDNNKEYPDDTVEDCDALLKDLSKIEQGITNYSNIGENKYKTLLTHIDRNQYNEELLLTLEKVLNSFFTNIKDCLNQLKEIENKSLQRKIELLQTK